MSHKVVAYPLAALRQQRLSQQRVDGTVPANIQTESNAKEMNIFSNMNKVNPAVSNSRPRSLSAGRTRQFTSDLVQDVYDRLGVNRIDLSSCVDENASMPKKMDGSSPTALNDKFPARYQVAATRGRGRQPVSPSPGISVSTTDSPETSQRRSRSLSRGRVANTQWPPAQSPNENVHSPSQRSHRNAANGIIFNNSFSSNSKSTSNSDWKDEKKVENEDYSEVVKAVTSQECEDPILRVTPPSVKDRSRIYGGSLSDQSTKPKNTKKSNIIRSNVSPNYATGFASRAHPPKINIFEDVNQTRHRLRNENNEASSYSKDDDDQRSSNTAVSKQLSLKLSDSQSITNNKVATDVSPNNTKNGSIANAFLAAITPTNKTPQRKPNFTPVLEIQTSTEDNDGTSADTISISMSSVSADEFSKSVDHIGLSPSIHSHNGTNIPTTNQVNRFRGCSSSSDNKKIASSWQDRNRLSSYNNSSNSSITASKGKGHDGSSPRQTERAYFQQAPTPTHQNVSLHATPDGMISESRMESLIDERVNARMSEYEARMEKMILKFMQTVDEKMSARMSTVEAKINNVSAALAELNKHR